MTQNAAQFQYSTPSSSLPHTGFDVIVPLEVGTLLIFIGVCIWTAVRR